MCDYKTTYVDLFFREKEYQCKRKDWKDGKCIFHHEDVKGKKEDFERALQKEFEEAEAQEKIHYDCVGWVFPETDQLEGYNFKGPAYFSSAQFSGDAYFSSAQFSGDADFRSAQFSGPASFSSAQFSGPASFSSAQFSGYADFRSAEFSGPADFRSAQFSGPAYFSSAQFSGDTYFRSAQFSGDAYFRSAQFSGPAYFSSAQFSGDADFSSAQFSGDAFFIAAYFSGACIFRESCFYQSLDVGQARFKQAQDWQNCFIYRLSVENTHLSAPCVLRSSTLLNIGYKGHQGKTLKLVNCEAVLKEMPPLKKEEKNTLAEKIREKNMPLIDFAQTEQDKEGDSTRCWNFREQDVSKLSFIDCDLSYADFISARIRDSYFDSCTWKKDKGFFKFHHHDERIQAFRADKTARHDLEKLQSTYQRFKRYFQDSHNYRLSGMFHYREMELKRLLAQQWHSDHIVLSLYHFFVKYGESYVRAFLRFIVVNALIMPLALLLPVISSVKNIVKTGLEGLVFLLSAVLPRATTTAMGLENKNAEKWAEQFCTGAWYENYTIGAVALYYITFFALLALFLMALNRRFRR